MTSPDLSPGQQLLLDRLAASDLGEVFYLSGGTALSAFHLHHRRSDDLDLFSRTPFDVQSVLRLVRSVSQTEPVPRRIHQRLGFLLQVAVESLRVEFVHYDFDCIEPPQPRYGPLKVDGLRDILANKVSAIIERSEPKDYCDLLFLLRQPGLDLATGMADCRNKFGWPGLDYLLQTALLRVDSLSAWPQTKPVTTLAEARNHFRELARSLIKLDDAPNGST
jgi:hypothetical protein